MEKPTLNDVMAELQALRAVVEKHLPDAVASRADREEVRLKDVRRKANAARAVAKLAGRK